jgi:hypothetical protein
LKADDYYTPSGVKLVTNTFSQQSINLYAEYGITNKFTSILSMPLIRINGFSTSNSVIGNGDAKIEFKYRLTPENSLPISISIAPELPIGRANALASSTTNPLDKINLPTGDGEFNVWSQIALSIPLKKIYLSTYGAYNLRTKYEGLAFRDLYQLGFEFGANPINNLWVNAKIKGQFATSESQHPELGFVRGDATTFTLISAEIFYKFSKNIGASATFLSGNELLAKFKNIYIAPYFSVGVIYQK